MIKSYHANSLQSLRDVASSGACQGIVITTFLKIDDIDEEDFSEIHRLATRNGAVSIDFMDLGDHCMRKYRLREIK